MQGFPILEERTPQLLTAMAELDLAQGPVAVREAFHQPMVVKKVWERMLHLDQLLETCETDRQRAEVYLKIAKVCHGLELQVPAMQFFAYALLAAQIEAGDEGWREAFQREICEILSSNENNAVIERNLE